MPETIVGAAEGGLPYSKGLTAQSLSASGLPLERAYELARIVERRLDARAERRIEAGQLEQLIEEVVAAEEGPAALRRYRAWRRLDRLDRPLIVMLAGTTGVGKSTLATMLAHRLGITRVIATDVIRQVLRAFFSRDFMPAVHYSAFEAAAAVEAPPAGRTGGAEDDDALDEAADRDLVGFARQAESVATGVGAIVERACQERTPMVLEGVHLLPGALDEELRRRCILVEALLVVEDAERHRGHLSLRAGERPSARYLERFEQIRKLQVHLAELALERGVNVIANTSVDQALGRTMELVWEAVGEASPPDAPPGTPGFAGAAR